MSEIKGDSLLSLEFLQRWAPDGPWVLSAVDPERKQGMLTKSFSKDELKEALAFIEQWNGKRNLYFTVNSPRLLRNKKLEKEHIGHCVAFHVDVDPPKGTTDFAAAQGEILRRLETFEPKPSVIIFSGGGYQGFWLLAEPIEIEQPSEEDKEPWIRLEAYNRGLEKDLGGDHCWNIDRIMRLPGSVNLPDKKKREAGRKMALATLAYADWEALYEESHFKPIETEKKTAPKSRKGAKTAAERFPLPEWATRVLENGNDREGPRSYSGDRSKALWAVACAMARANWEKDDIVTAITDKANKLTEHVYDQDRPQKYAERQADKALEHAGGGFIFNSTGAIATMQQNIRLACAKLDVTLTYDEFSRRTMIEGPEGMPLRMLNDEDHDGLYLAIDEAFSFRPSVEYFKMVIMNEARTKSFHPVREYLEALKWDGKKRIDNWLVEYGGMEDTPYSRAVGTLMLVAAVRRIRQPGCKFDEMLILVGKQGINKSTALNVMAVNEEWFTDSISLNMDAQKTIEQLSGKWIIEVAELKGMRAAEIEHIKAFCSRRSDRARMAWGRVPSEMKRQNVFFASTNSEQFLKDITGNRRFWPAAVKDFDIARLTKDRDQLWAEAAARESAGESIRMDPSLWAEAAQEQMKRVIDDPWIELFDKHVGEDTCGKILIHDLWYLVNIPEGQRNQTHNERLGAMMTAFGWEKHQYRLNGKRQYWYSKGTDYQISTRIVIERDTVTNKVNVFKWEDGTPHPYEGNGYVNGEPEAKKPGSQDIPF